MLNVYNLPSDRGDLSKQVRGGMIEHNSRQFTRIYPDGIRQDSSNVDPSCICGAWAMGSQMVCLNYQTFDQPMQIHQGKVSNDPNSNPNPNQSPNPNPHSRT